MGYQRKEISLVSLFDVLGIDETIITGGGYL